MTTNSTDLADFETLIAPVPAAKFFRDFHDRQWTRIEVAGNAERWPELMNWQVLNRLLDMNVWTAKTLGLMMDTQKVPAEAYCASAVDRNGQSVMQPIRDQVMAWLERGASLVLNEIETLHPPIGQVAKILERTLGAKASANLYFSSQSHKAFNSHFDRHDVYAFQAIGQKTWNVYKGRVESPIEHPAFLNIPQQEYDRMKGRVDRQVVTKAGDLLYLPRGQFHDALAEEGPSVHVTFSAFEPVGLDVLNLLWERAIADPAFRAYLPNRQTADPAALENYAEALANRLRDLAAAPDTLSQIRAMQDNFGLMKKPHTLPVKP